ncbi:MAG: hypothetical protein H6667_25775 [Ardenticatenaceae bacterium]|nr:hypothetical protein [Ardenticatenaceae bacterium]
MNSVVDSGIPVAAEFAAFYADNGGQRFFGEPITEGFDAGDDGRFTQYFQNMRLEYDEADGVVIFPLGGWALAGVNKPQPALVPTNSRSRAFPGTDFTVQDEFLTFYEAYNGEQLLGLPISPQMDEGDLRVQYFVNGRLEWHPELNLDDRVQVGPLGRDYFLAIGAPGYGDIQDARPVPFAGIERVDVYTAVENPVLYDGDEQTLYVTVFTPGQRPVDGISADVMITFGETTAVLDLGRTDGQGRIVVPFNNLAIPPGQTIELLTSVYSSDGRVIGQSTLMFKTWW